MPVLRVVLLAVAFVLGLLLTLPALVLISPFLLVAWLTRALSELGSRERDSVAWQDLIEFEPVIGWRPKPGLDVFGRADDLFHLVTGPDGWRGSTRLEDADIVAFGDSFAFGHGSDDDQMFSSLPDDVCVKPIGCDGYDMVQTLLWMERLAPHLHGKLVVWLPFYGNDLWDNLHPAMTHYRKPFLRQMDSTGDWEVVTDHVTPEPWPFPSRKDHQTALAEICHAGSATQRRAAGACEYLVERASAACADAGAELVVIGIPERIQLTERGRRRLRSLAAMSEGFDAMLPDRMVEQACDSAGVRFVPLSRHLSASDYLVQDAHWRPSGHRKLGGLLSELAGERSAVGASRTH